MTHLARLASNLACLVSALGLCACSSGTPAVVQGASAQGASGQGGAGAAAGRMDGPFYVEPGAPNPRACAADGDCLGDTVTDAGGCCVASSTPVAQSWAYHTWLSTHRSAAACASVSCRVFSPSPPLECELTVRCAEGACVNTCP